MSGKKPFFAALALWLVFNAALILTEAKLPFVDVFLYKDAGVNFALQNKFVTKNLPHMLHDEELIYAYQMPLYPFFYGVWGKAFGVSLKSSIAFDQLLKGLKALLLFLWIFPFIRYRVRDRVATGWWLAAALLLFALVPSYTDRPDDLAICLSLATLIGVERRRYFLAGLALGLTAATSPAAALLVLALVFIAGIELESLGNLVVTTLLTIAAVLVPLAAADPQAPSRFMQQVPFSVLPLWGLPAKIYFNEWYRTFWLAGKSVVVPLLVLLGLAAITWKQQVFRRYLLLSLIFAPIASFVWTYQIRYLWFPFTVAFGCLLVTVVQKNRERWARLALALLTMLFVPSMMTEGKTLYLALTRSPAESRVAVRDRVLSRVPSDARLAISADQYFTFRGERELAMAYYVCRWLDKYDYIYLSHLALQPKIEPPCHGKKHLFEIDSDLRDARQSSFLQWKIAGNGGVLFKRKNPLRQHHLAFGKELPR